MENLYINDNGPCPYLEHGNWISAGFFADELNGSVYESLISNGFRRCGYSFYKNICPNCNQCVPIRVIVDKFIMTKSQKKVLNRNKDVIITTKKAEFDHEGYVLYKKYCSFQHGKTDERSIEEYSSFLINSPVDTYMMYYTIDNNIAGIGWIDILESSISSVYFAFNPEYKKRSLGVYSILKEIEFCTSLNKNWLQLGFLVAGSKKMDYKSHFTPYQVLKDNTWCSST